MEAMRKPTFSELLVACAAMTLLVGCKPRQAAVGVGAGVADAELDTCGWYAITTQAGAENVAALVWFDEGGTVGPEGISFTDNEAQTGMRLKDGTRVILDYRHSPGTVAINGRPFSVKNGRLFLVNAADGSIRVQQYQCDFSKTPGNIEGVSTFEKTDPHLRQFIQALRAKAATQPAGD